MIVAERIKVTPYTEIFDWGGAYSAYGIEEHFSFNNGLVLPNKISISCRMFRFLAVRDAKRWLKGQQHECS